jgi:hypothetical protein
MDLNTPNEYRLTLKPHHSYEVCLSNSPRTRFHAPDTKVCPKLYVIMKNRDIHYVGITNRPMSARINFGLKANGNRGYHGYQWKNLDGDLRLLVWSFYRNRGKKFMRKIETIEAEFAFLVRNCTGRWPLSQTEIHFYTPEIIHIDAAQQMMRECLA